MAVELYGFELSMLSVMLNCMGSRGFEEVSGENFGLPETTTPLIQEVHLELLGEILVDGLMSSTLNPISLNPKP